MYMYNIFSVSSGVGWDVGVDWIKVHVLGKRSVIVDPPWVRSGSHGIGRGLPNHEIGFY